MSTDVSAGDVAGADLAPDLGDDVSLADYAIEPEDLVDETSLSLDARDELRDDRDDDRPVASWRALDYQEPVSHGHGIMAVLQDLDTDGETAYKRLWSAWRNHVGDPEKEPYVLLEDANLRFEWLPEDIPAHLVITSKPWKVAEDAVDGEYISRRYEYSLQLMLYDPEADGDGLQEDDRLPVSFQAWVQPQNEELVHKDGGSLVCQHGEGTKFKLQTTYATPSDSVRRLVDVANAALESFDRERPDWSTLNRGSLKLWKAELYHRFSKDLMSAVVQRLRGVRTIVETGGSADVGGSSQFYQGSHVKEVVTSDSWGRAGFIGDYARRDGYNLGLKVYRIAGNPSDERLKHPKLEAFLEGTDGEELPHIDEWDSIRATLRQMTSGLAIRSGVSLGDLREDDFYTVDPDDRVDTLVPTGWRKANRLANQERERRILQTTYEALSLAKWDVLYSVAMLDGATYDQLQEFTGYSRDWIREVVRELKENDILMRLTYPRVVVYQNQELRLNAVEKLQGVEPGRDMTDIKSDAEDRREDRREERERDDQEDDVDDIDDIDQDESSDSSSSSSTSPEWERVDRLDFSRSSIGRYLESGDIAAEDVKIRTESYDWIG